MCTFSGKPANRNKLTGSWFIQDIAQDLKEKSHDTNIEDIVKEVSKAQ